MNADLCHPSLFDQTPRISPSPCNLTDDAPLLLVYSGLSLALCWYDLRYGLLPDRLTCPCSGAGCSIIYTTPTTAGICRWRRHRRLSGFHFTLLALSGIRGYEGLGYGMSNFWPHLARGTVGQCCRSWFWRLSSPGSHAASDNSRESTGVIEQPAAFWPFLAAAGFGADGKR